MAGPLTVQDGQTIPKRAADADVYQFDWDARFLADGVTIATSTFAITAIEPSADTALVKNNESILTGSRKTQVRVQGGTDAALYRLDNTIVTSESPTQTKKRSIYIRIQER